jgi:phosphohistidine phosphatase
MKLYILRHAIAAERDPEKFPDDGQRPLTEAGRVKMTKIAHTLHKIDKRIDLILSSPLLRARDTAEIVRKGLHLKKDRLVLLEALAPVGNPGDLIAEIQTKYLLDSLLLVGHEPDLSGLISLLLAGDTSLSIMMKKGAICCLSVNELVAGKCATLEWLMSPAQLFSLETHITTSW